MAIYGVFVGIDQYRDDRIGNLKCSVADARAMCDLFENVGAQVQLILNGRASANAIRRSLAGLTRLAKSEDTVIFYYAGHGAREGVPRRNFDPEVIPFIVPHDSDRDDLSGTAIRIDHIQYFLHSIPARTVLFFFDSCYSGSAADSRSFELPGLRTVGTGVRALSEIGGSGVVVIAASREYEPAYEDTSLGHGIFTEYLIDALTGGAEPMSDGGVRLDSVYRHLSQKVPEKAHQLFNTRQSPVQFGESGVSI